jgi:hypothetical protein
MVSAEVVGHASANEIKLYPTSNTIAVWCGLSFVKGQHFRLEKLELQGHQEPIFCTP